MEAGLLCQMIARRLSLLTVATEPNAFRREFAAGIADYALHPDELDVATGQKVEVKAVKAVIRS
jgi:hypothetical protein